MINRVKVKNYRSLADVDVPLGKLTVLVGRNGAGKSTFIDVLRFVRDALRFNLETAIDTRGGIATIGRWVPSGRPRDIEIEMGLQIDEHLADYAFTLARSSQGSFRVKREYARGSYSIIRFDNGLVETPWEVAEMEIVNGKRHVRHRDPSILNFVGLASKAEIDFHSLHLPSQAGSYPGFNQLRGELLDAYFYMIFPNTLRLPQKPSSESILNDNGENLGSALKHILAQTMWKHDLILALHKLVGDIIDIRVRSIGGYLVTELMHQSSGKREKWLELAQESDGTIRMLGLLAALYQDPPPALIAIEEPELTVHPGALAILSDVLREASDRAQIVITTQSPDLISHFKAEEIQVVERVDGATEIGPIEEMQRTAIQDHLFTGGELMRMEGLRRSVVGGGVSA